MAKNITWLDKAYTDVPFVALPQTGGGNAIFYDDTGSQTITENGTYNVIGLAEAIVNVSGGGTAQQILCGEATPSASIGNDGDIYLKVSAGGSLETYPAEFTASGMSSTSNASACIGESADSGTSTANMYSSGQSTTGVVDYSFDLSSIPSNAVISSVSCKVKAHEENASRSAFTLQIYAGDTAKGSQTTVNGTSNTIYTLATGSWTRAELDSLILHTTYGYYGGLVAGATLIVEYEMAEPAADVTLTVSEDGWSITGSGLYKKTSGTWTETTTVVLEPNIKH